MSEDEKRSVISSVLPNSWNSSLLSRSQSSHNLTPTPDTKPDSVLRTLSAINLLRKSSKSLIVPDNSASLTHSLDNISQPPKAMPRPSLREKINRLETSRLEKAFQWRYLKCVKLIRFFSDLPETWLSTQLGGPRQDTVWCPAPTIPSKVITSPITSLQSEQGWLGLKLCLLFIFLCFLPFTQFWSSVLLALLYF